MYRTYIPAVPIILTIRSTTDANQTRTENKICDRETMVIHNIQCRTKMIKYKRTRGIYSMRIQSRVKPSYLCLKAYDSRTTF